MSGLVAPVSRSAILDIQSIEKTADATLAANETLRTIVYDNDANPRTFTLPPDAVAIKIGAWGILRKKDSSDTADIILARGSGVAFQSVLGNINLKLDSIGGDGNKIFWEKIAADTYLISGQIKA